MAGDGFLFCNYYIVKPYFYYAKHFPDQTSIYGYDKKRKRTRRGDLQDKNGRARVFWDNDPVDISAAISREQLWFISSHCSSGGIDHTVWIKQLIHAAGFETIDHRNFRRIEIYGFSR
jgi:hypothetical protein